MNQTQSEEHRDEKIQQHQNVENRSINTINNLLVECCQKQQDKFTQIKRPRISSNSNKSFQRWIRNTNLIAGHSMLYDMEERRISKKNRIVKVKSLD